MSGVADTTHTPQLPDTLRLGRVHLTVSTLDGSIAFYERALGLQLHDRDGQVATMGAGGEDLTDLLRQARGQPEPRLTPSRRTPGSAAGS